jgi:hypothetical protein
MAKVIICYVVTLAILLRDLRLHLLGFLFYFFTEVITGDVKCRLLAADFVMTLCKLMLFCDAVKVFEVVILNIRFWIQKLRIYRKKHLIYGSKLEATLKVTMPKNDVTFYAFSGKGTGDRTNRR